MKEEIKKLILDILTELSGVEAEQISSSKNLVKDLGLNHSKMKRVMMGVEIGVEEEIENVREIPFEKFDDLCVLMLNARQLDKMTEVVCAAYKNGNHKKQ